MLGAWITGREGPRDGLVVVRPCQKPDPDGRVGAARRNGGFLNHSAICRCRAKEPEPPVQLADGMETGARRSCQRPDGLTFIPRGISPASLHLGEAGRETKAGAKTLSRT